MDNATRNASCSSAWGTTRWSLCGSPVQLRGREDGLAVGGDIKGACRGGQEQEGRPDTARCRERSDNDAASCHRRISSGPCGAGLGRLEDCRADCRHESDRTPPAPARAVPAWVDKVEYWEIDESAEALARIEHEVMDLTARLIRGGERQKPPPPELATRAASPSAHAPVTPANQSPETSPCGRAETKGRRGKGVTTVSDLPLTKAACWTWPPS